MKQSALIFLAVILAGIFLAGCQKTEPIEYPNKILEQYLEAWAWADTAKMYDLLTGEEKQLFTLAEYDQNFEELPIRPYQYKITGTSVFGKTAKIKVELLMPAMTATAVAEKHAEFGLVSRERLTFILKKENNNWRVSEKETYKR